MAESYDAIVIGTGQAGPPLAVRLGNAGRRTAIIERKLIGGTCVNVGCIPTKTLIASARAAHVARRAADFGVVLDGPVRVDMARIKARKDAIVAQSNANVTKWIRAGAERHADRGPRALRRPAQRAGRRAPARSAADLHQCRRPRRRARHRRASRTYLTSPTAA